MSKKIKVLAILTDDSGVGYHRCINPHKKLDSLFGDEFDVVIDRNPDYSNLSLFDEYDIITINKGIVSQQKEFDALIDYCKEKNITTVLDLDDYWDVGQFHPSYIMNSYFKFDEIIKDNMRKFDYITTTTELFAEDIRKFNKNVVVIPNALDPEEKQCIPQNIDSKRLRIGMVMGAQHENDVKLLDGVASKLPKDVLDKIQFVLCGWDLRGTMNMITNDGIKTRPYTPQETAWYKYETILTSNYKIVSPQYKEYLHLFIPNGEYPNIENEAFRRSWTKDVYTYLTHYNLIDVLLAPLKETKFNYVKSQLKVIEAGFFKKAIIASNYGPYTIDLHNAIEKGGTINPNGNAILIDSKKNHKDWAKNIERLVKEPELLKQLQNNLYETVKDKYNLNTTTKQRAEFYRNIVKKRD